MIDFEVAKRIKCSKDEKRDILPLIDTIVQISDIVAEKGLSELNKYGNPEQMPVLLRKGLMLAASGVDALTVRDIFDNYIVSGDYSGAELLKRIIISDGIQLIQRGDCAEVIREVLIAYLGEDFIMEPEFANDFADNKNIMKTMAGRTAINRYNKSSINESVMKDMDRLNDVEDSILAERLEMIDPKSLQPLLAVCDDTLKNRIINLMPEDNRNHIDSTDMKNITMEDVQLSLLLLGILPGLE